MVSAASVSLRMALRHTRKFSKEKQSAGDGAFGLSGRLRALEPAANFAYKRILSG